MNIFEIGVLLIDHRATSIHDLESREGKNNYVAYGYVEQYHIAGKF
jgi:hypothetical protein